MDIKNKFKQGLAAAGTVALLATSVFSGASTALAGTYYDDVNSGDWFQPYVDQLAGEGVFDTGPAFTNFNPGNTANRAETAKTLAEVLGLLDGYEAPAQSAYTDVPTDAWYYTPVMALTEAGIVSGRTDAQGNSTGIFDPGAKLNRAEVSKMIAEGFQLPAEGLPKNTFPDVQNETTWFYEYVNTVWGWSIVDGYAAGPDAGKFGPGNDVLRAELAKMMVGARNPVMREGEPEKCEADEYFSDDQDMCVVIPDCDSGYTFNTTTEQCEEFTNSDGTLTVELSEDNPAGVTVPRNATSIPMMMLDFTATGDDVFVDELQLTRAGLGDNDDFDGFYPVMWMNGEVIEIGNERNIVNDESTVTFLLGMDVPAGETVTVEVRANTSDDAGVNNEHYLSVVVPEDIDTNAASLDITTPLKGNTFEIGGITLETIVIEAAGNVSNVTVGQKDAILTEFKIRNDGANDVWVRELTLENGGSINSDDISDLSLTQSGDVLATLDGPKGDLFTFQLDEGFQITSGNTRTFKVLGTPVGRTNVDKIRLYFAEDYHVVVVDEEYGFANPIDNQFTFAFAPEVTLEGGPLTFSNNGPASTEVSNDTDRIPLLEFALTLDSNYEMNYLPLDFFVETPEGYVPNYTANNTGTGIAAVAAGVNGVYNVTTDVHDADYLEGDAVEFTCGNNTYYGYVSDTTVDTTAGGIDVTSSTDLNDVCGAADTFSEVNPYAGFTNLRFVDMDDDGSTLDGPSDVVDGTEVSNTDLDGSDLANEDTDTYYTINFDNEQYLTAGTHNLGVVVDTDQALAPYRFRVESDNNNADQFKGDDNQFALVADIEGGDLVGNNMIVSENSLAVALSNIVSSQVYVANQSDVNALAVNFQAGEARDIEITELNFDVRANSDGTWDEVGFLEEGDTAANQMVSSVALYHDDVVIADSTNLSENNGDYFVRFDDTDFDEPLVVEAGESMTLTAVVKLKNNVAGFIALDMDPSTDVDAEDTVDNDSVLASGGLVNAFGNLVADAYDVQLEVINTGALTIESTGNPNSAIALTGSQQFLASKLTFKAEDEAYRVKQLTLHNDDVATDNNFATAEATEAVTKGFITYYDEDLEQEVTKSADFVGGVAKLIGLNIVVPKDGTIQADIKVNVHTIAGAGEDVSGATFRVGPKDSANNNNTFEAIGVASNKTITNPTFQNTASIKQFVVRRSKPVFAKQVVDTDLGDGDVELYEFDVTADGNAVSFGRIIFDVDVNDADVLSALTIDDFRLLRDGALVDESDVDIFSGANNLSVTGGDSLTDGLSQVIVSFIQEETVNPGDPNTYTLMANVSASDTDDSLKTTPRTGDENTPVTGLTVNNGNANTGRLVDADADEGLVTTATALQQTPGTARNVLWSDKSAGAGHVYDTDDGASSLDFTNGYLLKLNGNLTSSTLSQ